MDTVSLRISDSLGKKLTKLAREQNRSKSALIREALESYLESDGQRKRLSAYDLTKDLCGSVIDAPADLSTNKKYFEGFGE